MAVFKCKPKILSLELAEIRNFLKMLGRSNFDNCSQGISVMDDALTQPASIPQHFHLLSAEDTSHYLRLRDEFRLSRERSKRGDRIKEFLDQLMRIRSFVQLQDGQDWKRSLVCGVFFLDDGLAMNIQQLRVLLGKCKSSINGSIQKLGSSAQGHSQDLGEELSTRIPPCYHDFNELKKWTIRKSVGFTPSMSSPFIIPVPSDPFQPPSVEVRIPCPVKYRSKWNQIPYNGMIVSADSEAVKNS
jgi:hypothetical protein